MNTFEELLFQNNNFFSAIFFQNHYFFRDKHLPRNRTLRTGNSLVQLPFGTATNRRYLQKSYFFEADSFAQHQFFQKSKILEKATFSKRKIPHNILSLETYLFNAFFDESLPSIAVAIFSEELLFTKYLFRRVTISQVPFFSTSTPPIN